MGHDVLQSGVGPTAINNPERNQIWRTGVGTDEITHTHTYVCVCVYVHTKGSDPRKWRWNQSDIMQTSRQTSRQNSGQLSRNRLSAPAWLSEGCELTPRRLR